MKNACINETKMIPSRASVWGWVLMACWGVTLLPASEKPAPAVDAAAHAVIVPYDPAIPLKDQVATRYYLDYETFQKLWSQAKESRMPERSVPDTGMGAAVNMALHRVQVRDEELIVTTLLEAGSRGDWQTLPLQLSAGSNAVAAWELDGQIAPLKDGSLVIEKSGAHRISGQIVAPMARGWREVNLLLPEARGNVLAVEVPATDGMPEFDGVVVPLMSENTVGELRTYTFALPAATMLRLKRSAARRRGDTGDPAVAEIATRLTARPGGDHLETSFRFKFPGLDRSHFVVVFDKSLQPLDWTIPGLKGITFREENGRMMGEITLAKPVREEFGFSISLLKKQPYPPSRRTVLFVGARAGRADRTVELLGSGPVRLTVADAGIDAERLPGLPGSGADQAGRWRLKDEASLTFSVAPAGLGLVSRVESLYQVGTEKVELHAAVRLSGGRLALREIKLLLPSSCEVQSLQGSSVRSWQQDADGIHVQFLPTTGVDARFVVSVAQTQKGEVGAVALPSLQVEGVPLESATVYLSAHAATDLRLPTGTEWREFDPVGAKSAFRVASPWTVKRALKWESARGSTGQTATVPAVTLIRQESRFSVDAVLLAQATDQGLRFSQQVGILVDQGVLRDFRLRLPAALPEARVAGPGVRDVQVKLVGAEREYQIGFQGDVMGATAVTLDWETPFDDVSALPLLEIVGATRTRRFFIVDNGSTREIKTAVEGADAANPASVPYLPAALGQAEYFLARGGEAKIAMTFSRTEMTAGNSAIVTLAEITSALRPNGERWETVTYSLSNRSLQFLPVRLPPHAELVAVMVGGQTVRADEGTRDGRSLHLIPLLQMRPGELSQIVRLVYRVTSGDGALAMRTVLDDPELVGLSAERTLWNLWVPEGYRARNFEGNMEPVVEEIYEDEKAQQKLSDVLRLNQVVSSSSVSESDAREAWFNANKAVEELKDYVSSKRGGRSEYRDEAKVEEKREDADAKKRSNELIERQVVDQGQLLTDNRASLERRSGGQGRGLSKSGAGTLQMQGQGLWLENGANSNGVQREASRRLEGTADAVLNDNVAVDAAFLSDDAAPQAKSQMPAVLVGANSRANSFAQGAATVTSGELALNGGSLRSGGSIVPSQEPLSLTGAGTVARGGAGEVDRLLQVGNSSLATGDYGGSVAGFQGVIQIDAANSAAREGLQNAEQKRAEYADDARDHQRAKMLSDVSGAWENQSVPSQLKPAGRHSLPVEVPLNGTVYHFRKLKDHARLEVSLSKPWEPARVAALWWLGIGGGVLGGIALVRQRWQRGQEY